MRLLLICLMVACLSVSLVPPAFTAVPASMNVQGRLTDLAGAPLPSGDKTFTFRIYDAEISGIRVWPGAGGEVQVIATDDAGLWTANVGAALGLTDAVFADTVRWLEVTVNDGLNPSVTLPRVRIVTGTYAHRVSTVDGAGGGTITSKVSIGTGHVNTGAGAFVAGETNEATGDYSAVGGGNHNFARGVNSVVGGGGSSNDADSNSAIGDVTAIGGGRGNVATGWYATIAGGSNNDASGGASAISGGVYNRAIGSWSVIGGGQRNSAEDSAATVAGGWGNEASGAFSFIGGGGGRRTSNGNTASGSWTTIGGGISNAAYGVLSAVCGGYSNSAGEEGSAIGGGYDNEARADYATVAGGRENSAMAQGSSVSGGRFNKARGDFSTICGGGGYSEFDSNMTSGVAATVVGGRQNLATGDRSLAAGYRAHAIHDGAFVWSDGAGGALFTSTGINQFLVKAAGGMAIGSDDPGTTTVLEVSDMYHSSYIEMIRFQSATDPDPGDDIIVIEAPSTAPDDFQFIECERGSDQKVRLWGNGNITADGTITGGGADMAEMVFVSTGARSVEPGDVMVIDRNNPRALTRSATARTTLVAGIYSSAPGFVASEHDWDQLALDRGLVRAASAEEETRAVPVMEVAAAIGEIPLAVVGIVPCKVTAENGPIRPGDLLVTSNTPGHAMRDNNPSVGTVIGKAMGGLRSGTGTVDVLVTLQ